MEEQEERKIEMAVNKRKLRIIPNEYRFKNKIATVSQIMPDLSDHTPEIYSNNFPHHPGWLKRFVNLMSISFRHA